MRNKKVAVYTASKTTHAAFWLELRTLCPEVHWTARWPFFVSAGVEESPEQASSFWLDDQNDVRAADIVLVYAAKDDVLRGALVEVGMALEQNKKIYLLGETPSFGSWQHHPNVTHIRGLNKFLFEYAGGHLGSMDKVQARFPDICGTPIISGGDF